MWDRDPRNILQPTAYRPFDPIKSCGTAESMDILVYTSIGQYLYKTNCIFPNETMKKSTM